MQPTDPNPTDGNLLPAPDRRKSPRVSPNSLSYVNLDEFNGGIVVNISEGGLAVQAAMNVMEDILPNVRLQIPRSKIRIEGSARVVWTGDSRKTVGIEFDHLPEDARKQLREWLIAEGAAVSDQPATAPETPSESELSDHTPVVDMVHVSQIAHPLPIEADEIVLSTLLMTSEHASSIPISAQNVPALRDTFEAPALIPGHTEQHLAPAEQLPAAKSPEDLRNRYMPVIAALAILSLAAGWEAGRGNMFQSFFGIFESSAAAPLSTSGAAQRAAVNPASLSFLVVDATNQSWLVPFAGPISAPPSAPIPALPPQSRVNDSSVAAATKAPIRQWTLAAPQTNRQASNIQNSLQAPQFSNPQQNGANELSAAITNGVAAPAPPVSAYSNLVPVTVVHRIDPIYPPSAIQQRVDGTVKVHAHISETGAISEVSALNGSPLLQAAAVAAVKKWTFKAEILDGRPVASDFDVNIRFSLPQ